MEELSEQLRALGKKPELVKVYFQDLKVGQVFYTSAVVTPFEKYVVDTHKGCKVGREGSTTATLKLYDNTIVYIPKED